MLIGTVIILFVHKSFINVASDSSPESDDALPAQDKEGVCSTAARVPSLQRGRCLAY